MDDDTATHVAARLASARGIQPNAIGWWDLPDGGRLVHVHETRREQMEGAPAPFVVHLGPDAKPRQVSTSRALYGDTVRAIPCPVCPATPGQDCPSPLLRAGQRGVHFARANMALGQRALPALRQRELHPMIVSPS